MTFDSNIWWNSLLLVEGNVFTENNFGSIESEYVNIKVVLTNDSF